MAITGVIILYQRKSSTFKGFNNGSNQHASITVILFFCYTPVVVCIFTSKINSSLTDRVDSPVGVDADNT